MKKHFTCISYDILDFLIPSEYVISGIYLSLPKDVPNITFNRETLPHLYIGSKLQSEFCCNSAVKSDAVLVFNSHDFAEDVRSMIVMKTDTAFPATGNVAISFTASISNHDIELSKLRLMPLGIRNRMTDCGICAVHYSDDGRKQFLISPDALLRRFFTGGAK